MKESTKTRQAVEQRIRELCAHYEIAPYSLAMKAGIPVSTLKSILNGDSENPGIVTIRRIADAFGITLADFFNSPLFQDTEPEIG